MSTTGRATDSTRRPRCSSDLEVRASNFMAALAPGHPGLMDSRPTPVNLFPTLFGAYLGRDIARQPDSIWAYRNSYIDSVEAPPIDGLDTVTARRPRHGAPLAAAVDRPRSRLPIALYPVALAVALVAELVNVGGVSPFSAVRGWIIVIVLGLLLSAIGRLLLGDKDRGGVLAAVWVIALLGGDDRAFALVIVAATVVFLLERYGLRTERRTIRWWWIGRWASRVVGVIALAVFIQSIQMGTLGDAVRSLTHETFLRPAPPPVAVRLDRPGHLLRAARRPHESGRHERRLRVRRIGLHRHPRGGWVHRRPRQPIELHEHLRDPLLDVQCHPPGDMPSMAGLIAGTEARPAGGVVREAINDNAMLDLLHGRGYEVEAIVSGWEQVTMREADRFMDGGQINEFEIGILRRSLVGHALESLAPDFVSAQQRDRITGVFAAPRNGADTAR